MRVALVTGAGSGIGHAASVALARRGFEVVMVGRREATLASALGAVTAIGGSARIVLADVTEESAVNELFRNIETELGRVDVLFNNAGVGAPARQIEELSLDEWNRVVAVNLTGTFLCTREAVRVMKRQSPRGGRIINNGSVSAHVPRPLSAAYTATKHAVTGLTKSTALDGRTFGIACGQIDIGNAATAMAAAMPRGALQADGTIRPEPVISPELVGETVADMACLPLEANIPFMTIMATRMPYIGRG